MLSFKILFVFKFFARNLFLPPQCALSVHILSSLFRQVCLTGRRTFTFGKCSIRIVRITFQCCLFLAAKVRVIMVYRSRISTRIHASLYGALKIEIFWQTFLACGCSSQCLFLSARRFERELTVFVDFVEAKIVG